MWAGGTRSAGRSPLEICIGGYDADRRGAILKASNFHCRQQHMPTNSVKVTTVLIGLPLISRSHF